MKLGLFTNWTEEEFTGYWDGKGRPFAPGEKQWMPRYLAEHFAKHLTNRELLRVKPNGQPVYKDGEKFTSPKKPEDVPLYMKLFNKAFTPDPEDTAPGAEKKNDIDDLIKLANKTKESQKQGKEKALDNKNDDKKPESKSEKEKKDVQDPDEPQVITPPDDDEDGDDDSSFV